MVVSNGNDFVLNLTQRDGSGSTDTEGCTGDDDDFFASVHVTTPCLFCLFLFDCLEDLGFPHLKGERDLNSCCCHKQQHGENNRTDSTANGFKQEHKEYA